MGVGRITYYLPGSTKDNLTVSSVDLRTDIGKSQSKGKEDYKHQAEKDEKSV